MGIVSVLLMIAAAVIITGFVLSSESKKDKEAKKNSY